MPTLQTLMKRWFLGLANRLKSAMQGSVVKSKGGKVQKKNLKFMDLFLLLKKDLYFNKSLLNVTNCKGYVVIHRNGFMKNFILIFIAFEILLCTAVLVYCNYLKNENLKEQMTFFYSDEKEFHLAANVSNEAAVAACVEKRLNEKYFQKDSAPLIYGNVCYKFVNFKNIILQDSAKAGIVDDIPFSTPIKRIKEIFPKNIQKKILSNWFEKDSIILIGEEANEIAKSTYSLKVPYYDTVIVSFHREDVGYNEREAKKVIESKFYRGNSSSEHRVYEGEFSFCREKGISFELLYLGNGLSYFYIKTMNPIYSMKQIKIVDVWKNNFIPIIELCDDCEFRKVDSAYYELSGMVETTKARGDLISKKFVTPKLQFYALFRDSLLGVRKNLYTENNLYSNRSDSIFYTIDVDINRNVRKFLD